MRRGRLHDSFGGGRRGENQTAARLRLQGGVTGIRRGAGAGERLILVLAFVPVRLGFLFGGIFLALFGFFVPSVPAVSNLSSWCACVRIPCISCLLPMEVSDLDLKFSF